jgi:hypothetical protein
MGRDRRNGRANMKTRVGIAAAAVIGGGAIAIAAVAASHGSGSPAAQSAGYSARISNNGGEWGQLNSVMNNWSWARTSSMNTLSSLTSQSERTYSTTTMHGKTLVEQRGIVVLATRKFVILQSANGSLHLWLLSGRTAIQNVSSSTMGTSAMTASMSATTAAMQSGNMMPAANLMAGSTLTAAQMLTPTPAAQTVTVNVAGTDLTVTVTITKSTATVSQTATMPANANPWWSPSTTTQSAWMTATPMTKLTRGDLALIVGSRSHNLLHAQIVLFTPLTTGDVGGRAATGTGTTPVTTPNQPVVSSTTGSSGVHY